MTRVEASGSTAAAAGVAPRRPGRALPFLGRTAPRTAMDRVITATIVLTVVANLVYLAALLLPGDPDTALIDNGLSDLAEGIPVVVFWLVAARTGFARAEVILAAAAMTFNLAGDVYYGLAMNSAGDLPSPSPADIGYLLYYPLMGAALVVTVLRQSRRATGAVILDVALASLGAASVLAVLLGPVLTDALGGANALDNLIALLYPLFDLLLVAAVAGVAASPVLRVGPRAPFLVLGLLVFTGADVWYAIQNHDGAYSSGSPLDVMWTAAVALVAVWVVGVGRARVVDPPAPRTGRMLPIPAFAVLAGLAVLVTATQIPVSMLALVLAAATIALSAIPVMFRQANLTRMLESREQVVERMVVLDKAKSDMIATVNHEMRTPLTTISGYIELVLDGEGGPVPPAAKEMLRVAETSTARLQGLVGDMLLLTRLEAAGGERTSAPVRIDEAIRRVVEALAPVAQSRDIVLRIEGASALTVDGDRGQLERAFSNVIDNALKFSPAGGTVRIQLGRAREPSGRPNVTVSVLDTGIGIPHDAMPSLFDRFFRASNARDAAVPGSGLGLPIVRNIVEGHGGRVALESVLGEGTTVRFTLPLALDAPASAG